MSIPLDTGGFRVHAKQCKNCLFSKDRLVSPKRMQQIIRECVQKQSYFICHCDTEHGEENAEGGVCCRGFFDSMGQVSQMIRIATRLNMIRFVDLPPMPPGTKSYNENRYKSESAT